MTLKQYQSLCIKSEPKYLTRGQEALMGLMGLNAAAGKALGMYQETLFVGVELPQEGLIEVLGDAVRHIAIVAHSADIELGDVLKKNAASMNIGTDNSDAGDK